VLVYNTDGKILDANDASAEQLEYSVDELTGMMMQDVILSDDASALQEHVDETRRRGCNTLERAYTSRSGREIEAEVHERAIEFNGRDAILSVARDITGPKRAEQKLEETNHQLEHIIEELRSAEEEHVEQERRRALTQMASGIAHDFNNSLSTVRGFTDLLLQNPDNMEDVDTVKRYLQNIRRAANSAAETVRRMRKFYRPGEKRSHKRLDINAIVQEAISMTEPRWQHEGRAEGKSIDVKLQLKEVPEIKGNESELYEMLTNLIFNAVDAIEQSGKIVISTRNNEDEVRLTVRDTGCGMDAETRNNCLNPFYTSKGDAGTGLGLSVTQSIIQRHDGTLNIESAPGQGTTFDITFPAADEEVKKETGPEGGKKMEKQEILVVEDDQSQRKLLGKMLQSQGHLVELAKNGKEGLQKFDNGWYSLVMTDRAMPEVNGDQLAQLIKERAPEKPVVMITGFGDMMDAADESPEGVDLLVSKPITMEKLKNAISRTKQPPMQNQ
jgi:PAS domain S-box-containing protein